MAAQSKTTAVHFSLIFFVMLSVILGVMAYLFRSDYTEREAAFIKAQQELSAANAAGTKYLEEIDALKKVVGLEQPDVGVGQTPPADNTVLAQANAAIRTLGTNASAPSLYVALRDLRNEYNNLTLQNAQRDSTNADLRTQLEAALAQYKEVAKTHDDRATATEQDLAGVQKLSDEQTTALNAQITQVREENVALQTELQQTKEQTAAQVARLESDINELTQTNARLTGELDEIKGESFEVADGKIVRVDQVGRTVWIDLGSDDGIRKRTTFSVYERNNAGIGREGSGGGRPEDIKGSIEVTRTVPGSPHLAEARILDDDSSRPISPGDPIYSPLWSAGRQEQFAFAGKIDIDGDGSYVGDRERLHELVQSVGAKVSGEILDDGTRAGDPIDEETRFLVVAPVPSELSVPAGPERDALRNMSSLRVEMEKEAERNGVRIVNLNTFLDYVGYVPQQRRFVPGEAEGWNLQSGSRRPNTRSSTGNTSGLFDTRRARPNQPGNTSGSTSQTFDGNDRRAEDETGAE